MIAPNLATMSHLFTNADINSNLLKTLLKKLYQFFNAISVDSDQSTNDMVSFFPPKH